jgi:hypothetical protein
LVYMDGTCHWWLPLQNDSRSTYDVTRCQYECASCFDISRSYWSGCLPS